MAEAFARMVDLRKHSYKITFQPEGKSVNVLEGTTLLEAGARAGIELEVSCGGAGTCGKCKVRIVERPPDITRQDAMTLDLEDLDAGWRLSCQTRVDRAMVVETPETARVARQSILTEGAGLEVAPDPLIVKKHVPLEPPSVLDLRADLDRLRDAVLGAPVPGADDEEDEGDNDGGQQRRARVIDDSKIERRKSVFDSGLDISSPVRPTAKPKKKPAPRQSELNIDLSLTREIPGVLREHNFDVTLVLAGDDLIAIEPGDTTRAYYGVAVDLGTTTVVGMLVDLRDGKQIATAATGNPQVCYGDDVIARIDRCRRDPGETMTLNQMAIACLNEIIDELCAQAALAREHIYEIAVAGNATMTHLLLSVPPMTLAQAPYVGTLRQSFSVEARKLGLRGHRHARLYALPSIAGFVGGDTVAVILASAMHEAEEMTLAIDIGTNGELVMGTRERLVACSTAAGPAFEGARIQQGMRASNGAIDRARIDEDVHINVIGGGLARGICGTGLIDIVAQLLRLGVIDVSGRILGPDDCPPTVSESVRKRLLRSQDGYRFLVGRPGESEKGMSVYLNQNDVNELQMAKAAIMAGARLLAAELGGSLDDARHVLLAGAFGNYINPVSARVIGLLPDLPDDRLRFIGNAASAGARMALMSRKHRALADRISRRVHYVEMASSAEFQNEFTNQMMFEVPERDR